MRALLFERSMLITHVSTRTVTDAHFATSDTDTVPAQSLRSSDKNLRRKTLS